MKKPTVPKKATPATGTSAKTAPSGMMISGKSTGTVHPTSSSALGKMPTGAVQKKAEPASVAKQPEAKKEEVKAPKAEASKPVSEAPKAVIEEVKAVAPQ